jgi:hypothetical protein
VVDVNEGGQAVIGNVRGATQCAKRSNAHAPESACDERGVRQRDGNRDQYVSRGLLWGEHKRLLQEVSGLHRVNREWVSFVTLTASVRIYAASSLCAGICSHAEMASGNL